MNLDWQNMFTKLGGLGASKVEQIGFLPFLTLMGISLLSSLFILALYLKFYKSRSTGSQVHLAFPLLSLSITGIFISIQFSLPLSLGLLGALSIVRFRTPIKEPEEIGFILLIVASSLCCATFNLLLLAVLMTIALIALIVMHLGRTIIKGKLNDGMLIISISKNEYQDKLQNILKLLEDKIPKGRLDSISENGDEAIVSYNFIRLNRTGLLEIQNELVLIANNIRSNFFFNKSSEI
jgi:hypothetical protein